MGIFNNITGSGTNGAFIFKGSIVVAADFPTPAEVQNGWTYSITADVIDNDTTKTNTGQSFKTGDIVAWNGTNWTDITGIEVWIDDGTNVKTINSRDVDLQSKGLKDVNVSTAVKLGSATDTSLNTTKKDILGGINENKSNIDLKANDSAVVHLTGNETIADVKTFSSSPIVPTPTTDMQAATKKYVDDNISGTFSRNIGELVQSTLPLSDGGLKLLNGSLVEAGGAFNAFYLYIKNIYDGGLYPDLFISEANWQTSVSTYGTCGKFVFIDGVSVRLPKIFGFVEGTILPTTLGDLTEAGLPNITGNTLITLNKGIPFDTPTNGAFFKSTSIGNEKYAGDSASLAQSNYLGFNASLSSTIYDNSTTVQPQSIKLLYYICVATTVVPVEQANANLLLTDLDGKADLDLNNITTAGEDKILSLAMPLPINTASTIGLLTKIESANGEALAVPAGGTWAVLASWSKLTSTAVMSNFSTDEIATNVVAGGTTIRNARANYIQQAFIIKIA